MTRKRPPMYGNAFHKWMQNMAGKGGRDPDKIGDDHRFYALLAQTAYQEEHERQPFMEEYVNEFGYERHDKMSNESMDVWVPKDTHNMKDHAMVVFRGTKTLEDLGTDAYVATGTLSSSMRFREDKAYTQKVLGQLQNEGIQHFDFVGHSLGGSLAVDLGREMRDELGMGEVHAFNPGSGLKEALTSVTSQIKGTPTDSHVNRYHIAGDGVSTLSNGMHDFHYEQACGASNPHSISNFTGVGLTCRGEKSGEGKTNAPTTPPEKRKEAPVFNGISVPLKKIKR